MLSKPIIRSNPGDISLEEITLLAPDFDISDLPKSLNSNRLGALYMHRSVECVPSVQHRAGQVLLDTYQAVNTHINCSHLSLGHLKRCFYPAD